jgi:hypothetical protein
VSIDLSVPGGSAANPGFVAQRSPFGITISAGRIGQGTTLFGVTRDQNGLLVNAFPMLGAGICTIRAVVDTTFPSANVALRGDITLERLDEPEGAVIDTVCTMLDFQWWFSHTYLYSGLYSNNLSTGSGFGLGFGLLAPGHYRLTIHWYDYFVSGGNWSYKALDVKEFTVAGETTITLPLFTKHTNQTAPEWS